MLEFITWTVGTIIAVVIGVDLLVTVTEVVAEHLRSRQRSTTPSDNYQRGFANLSSGREGTEAGTPQPSILPLPPQSDSISQQTLESARHKAKAA